MTMASFVPRPAEGGPISSTTVHESSRVYYASANGDLQEMAYGNGAWAHADLSATFDAPEVGTGAAITAINVHESSRVYYASAASDLQEMAYGNGAWAHADLSATFDAPKVGPGAAITAINVHESSPRVLRERKRRPSGDGVRQRRLGGNRPHASGLLTAAASDEHPLLTSPDPKK